MNNVGYSSLIALVHFIRYSFHFTDYHSYFCINQHCWSVSCSYWHRQTVPIRCSSRCDGTVADSTGGI